MVKLGDLLSGKPVPVENEIERLRQQKHDVESEISRKPLLREQIESSIQEASDDFQDLVDEPFDKIEREQKEIYGPEGLPPKQRRQEFKPQPIEQVQEVEFSVEFTYKGWIKETYYIKTKSLAEAQHIIADIESSMAQQQVISLGNLKINPSNVLNYKVIA